MSKGAEIIRGDDQTLSIPVSTLFTQTLVGARAYLFVLPTTAAVSDTILNPAAIITSTLGPFLTQPSEFNFKLTSQPSVANSSLVPVGKYAWYSRVVEADATTTTIQLKPSQVEVFAPGDGDC